MKTPIVVFGKLEKNYCGMFFPPDVIVIDLTKDEDPARVLIHEILHMCHPKTSEGKILMQEIKIWNSLDQHQRFMVYRFLFNRKYEETGVVRCPKPKHSNT